MNLGCIFQLCLFLFIRQVDIDRNRVSSCKTDGTADAAYKKVVIRFCLHKGMDQILCFFKNFIFQLLLDLTLLSFDLKLGFCESLVQSQFCIRGFCLDPGFGLA